MTRGPGWTKAEDAVLRREYPAGGVAACKPGLTQRNELAIGRRAKKLKLHRLDYRSKGGRDSKPPPDAPPETKTRACLKCREDFESEWAGERVCPKCKNGRVWRMAIADTLVSSGRAVSPRGAGP